MENIYRFSDIDFEQYIKERLDPKVFYFIKKYTCSETAHTTEITKWFYKMYVENQLPEIDFVVDNYFFYCEVFTAYKKLFAAKRIKPIMDYKKWNDFYNDIVSLSDVKSRSEKEELARKGAIIIAQQGDYVLYDIKTWEASQKYGKATKWCTASKISPKWFEIYVTEPKQLFYMLNKSSLKKYLVSILNNKENSTPYIMIYNELNETLCGFKPLFKDGVLNEIEMNDSVVSKADEIMIKWLFEELEKYFKKTK